MQDLTLRRRIGALGLAAVLLLPASTSFAQAAPIAPAGQWERHGFGITINDDGTASADWRVYRWCGPGVPDPCDQLLSNQIVDGGHADITFSGADDAGVFQGNVDATTDPELLDLGAVRLTLQPYDMALLEQGGTQLTLCGDDSADLAPSMDAIADCGA